MHLKNFPKRLDSKTSSLRITVPENLDLALEGLIRKVLREQPKTDHIHSFAAEYFETLLKIRDKAGAKYTSEQLCPFHDDEDAHEMIKLANTFGKPSKKSPKESPQAEDKMVESGVSRRRTDRPKAKQGKQTTPDLIKKLPGNRPEEKDKKEEGEKENQEEELLTGDPIKELVEKELEMEALAKRTKAEGDENTGGDNGRSVEEKKRSNDAEEPTGGEGTSETVRIPAAEETLAKDEYPADETDTKKTEETPIEAKVTNGEPVDDKPSTAEKDSEMTDPAAEEETAVRKDDGDKPPSDEMEAKTPSPTVEDKLPTAEGDTDSEATAEVNAGMRNGDGATEIVLKEAKDEEKEAENGPRQLMTGNDGTEPQLEGRSHSAEEDKAAEVQEKRETETNIEAEEANAVEETLKTASGPTEDTEEQKINAENADQLQKQQEPEVEQKNSEAIVEQKEQESGEEQKQEEPGVEQKQEEPGVEQKQQEPDVEQQKQEPEVEQQKQEPEVEQKQQEPEVEQQKQEPEVEQKNSEAIVEQKEQESGEEQKQEEPEMEQKHQEPEVEHKQQELEVEQKQEEPGKEEKKSKMGSNSESEEKTPTEEKPHEQTETATETEPHGSEKTETAKSDKKEESETEEEVTAIKENVTVLSAEAEEVTPTAEEMPRTEDKPALLKPKENDEVDDLDRPGQQEKDDESKADASTTQKPLKGPEDETDVKEAGTDEGDKSGNVEDAEDVSPSTSGTAAVEKPEHPEPQEDTKPDIKEIQNDRQKDELNTTADIQQAATEDEQIDDTKQQEEELCTVVDSHHIIRIQEPEATHDDPGVAPPPEEVQIKTIQTHYYDALQVPEILTKEFRVHNVGAALPEDTAGAEENNSGPAEDAQVAGERAETADSSEKRPDDVPLLVTTPVDAVRSDDLLDLTTPTSGYSLNLSELSWQTVSGLFLDSERLHSSRLSDEPRYKTVIGKPEERDDIEEVFHRTVVPTLVGAVPMPPRDADEIDKEESGSSLEEKKERKEKKNKKLEDVSNSKSFDSDTPFISVEVKTVIETQVLDDEDEEEGRPRVELTVQATVDVEDVQETTRRQQDLPGGEEKDMAEGKGRSGEQMGASRESDSTTSSAATEIKRSDSGRRGVGAPGSLLQSRSLDLGGRNPLLRTRSLSTFRHGVTDFEVWSAIEKELEEAATKIQAKFRSYKARKKLQREDAVQITTEESSPNTTPAEADERQQSTGEFHDSIVLSDHPR